MMWGRTQNLGPIGSALLTLIGKKQTNKRTPNQAKHIYILLCWLHILLSIYCFIIKDSYLCSLFSAYDRPIFWFKIINCETHNNWQKLCVLNKKEKYYNFLKQKTIPHPQLAQFFPHQDVLVVKVKGVFEGRTCF